MKEIITEIMFQLCVSMIRNILFAFDCVIEFETNPICNIINFFVLFCSLEKSMKYCWFIPFLQFKLAQTIYDQAKTIIRKNNEQQRTNHHGKKIKFYKQITSLIQFLLIICIFRKKFYSHENFTWNIKIRTQRDKKTQDANN